MPHLTSTAARTFHLHGVTFTSFSASASGAAQLGAWRADFGPRTSGQPHRMSCEEVLFVLTGSLDIEIDEDRFTAEPGDAVLVPAGARFRASNDGADPATAWVTTQLGMRATMDGSGETLIPPWAE